jgi:O-6-methylguanine DNA methyltransferase
MFRYLALDTQLGWIVVAESSTGIALVDFLGPEHPTDQRIVSRIGKEYPGSAPEPGTDTGLLGTAKRHILAYLNNRRPIPEIPVDTAKGTVFQRKIWAAIRSIPFGETRSYKQLAEAAGNPGAARAAGGACGRNPVPLIIPCHRVIASGGRPGGFSSGLEIKVALLDLEKYSTGTQPARNPGETRQVSGPDW